MIGAGGEEGGARARAGSLEEVGNNNMFLLDFSMSLTQIFICLTLINKKTPNNNNLKINGLLGPLAHQPPSHLVREAGHNISPGLRKQLVVELELWISGGEVLATLPRRLFFRQAVPLDQEAPLTTTLLGLQDSLRDRPNAAILSRRKGTRRS